MSFFSRIFDIESKVVKENKDDFEIQTIYDEILRRSFLRKGIENNFVTNDDENVFFKTLIMKLKESNLNPYNLYFELMSNKAFNVSYNGYPIGKIKLRGKKTYMQLLKGFYDNKGIKNKNVEEYIINISSWIKHINFCRKD
ncbi:hypothetical protein [Sporomusa acidovorans]|uniref:Uncharacterized protein n=1 Tax=Sporomusa acidovorans (strain ATCC 49682 / DSM 3132 / Mol) TaxID=1123286 RepID=A0ABZ3J747_SPOA4|nr:hypothetical protein [Sporomusa acidovorans]OZC23816.1 hypothetical protein SPACI_04410 [Sporomusa acidovorans DSM 3132]SDF62076.1 hypothetical protein SAMN04488499_106321 [Sporomusa acidovorans]